MATVMGLVALRHLHAGVAADDAESAYPQPALAHASPFFVTVP